MPTRTRRLTVGVITAGVLVAVPAMAGAEPTDLNTDAPSALPADTVVETEQTDPPGAQAQPDGAPGTVDETHVSEVPGSTQSVSDEEEAPSTPTRSLLVTLDLYNLTDIHGHIEQVKNKSGEVVEAGLASMQCYLARETGVNPNSSFTLLGDNIGASPFTSGSLKDNPTIQALNVMSPLASTIGNHELDMGQDVFKQRVDGSNPAEFTQVAFPYLGANVSGMGTWAGSKPYLGDYRVWNSPSGVNVAFIGAIAEDVPYKLSPGTTEGLTFGDPIARIDSLAKTIKDSGEADIVIAMLDDDVKNNYPLVGEYVDGLMGGDTHVPYEFDKIDSAVTLDSKNPLLAGIASGSYTDNLGRIRISYDTTAKKVVSADSQLIPASEVAQCGEDPAVKAVVDAAIADSAEAGKKVVARGYTEAFRRGVFTDPSGNTDPGSNRGIESSLGDLVADAMRDTIFTTDGARVDIGIINAGGLRADLIPHSDGTITYADTYAVMPFSNELGYVTIQGADFKQALEDQWKTNLSSQNSRPLLKLGISDNVRYTYDPHKPAGERITSVTVDGEPLDLQRSYTVGSVTFLLAGGDSFPSLTKGGPYVTSGNLDRDKFNEYLGSHDNVRPRAVKSAIGVTLPSEPIDDGEEALVELRGLSFSEGPSITESVRVSIGGDSATAQVDNSLVEEHASDEASIITTDGAGRASARVIVNGQCEGRAGETVSAPVVIATDFATVVDGSEGLSIQVRCADVPAQPVPDSAAATPKLAATGASADAVALISIMLLGSGLAAVRARKKSRG